MTSILTNSEIDSIIDNVGEIIKNKISKSEIIKKDLDETNISILNLPIVRKIIYAYEEEIIENNAKRSHHSHFLNDHEHSHGNDNSILLDKISFLESKVCLMSEMMNQMKEQFDYKLETVINLFSKSNNETNNEEHIKLQIKEKENFIPSILFNHAYLGQVQVPSVKEEEEEEEEEETNELEEEEETKEETNELEEEEEEEETKELEEEEEETKELEEEEEETNELEEETKELEEETKEEETNELETKEEEEEDEEVFEVEIDDVTYFTNDEENGILYEITKNGDPGKKVGFLKDGEPIFAK